VPLVDAPVANVRHDGALAPLDWPSTADADDIAADVAEIVAAATAIAPANDTPTPVLTDDQRAILDFERKWWRLAGAKEQAIRDRFEMSPTRYYQSLNTLLDVPEALAYDPQLVNRLRRLRSAGPGARRLGPRSVG
jgi:hypothetical protein